MKYIPSLILFFAICYSLKSCTVFSASDDKKAYKTLCKKSPWKVKKLTISKVEFSETNPMASPVLWDTVLYDHGTFKFEKGNIDEFKGEFTFNSGKMVNTTHAISGDLDDEDLYLDFKITIPQSAYMSPHGSGYLNTKKGNSIKIAGKAAFWDVDNSGEPHYTFAEFITEEAYYKCDWELEAE